MAEYLPLKNRGEKRDKGSLSGDKRVKLRDPFLVEEETLYMHPQSKTSLGKTGAGLKSSVVSYVGYPCRTPRMRGSLL